MNPVFGLVMTTVSPAVAWPAMLPVEIGLGLDAGAEEQRERRAQYDPVDGGGKDRVVHLFYLQKGG